MNRTQVKEVIFALLQPEESSFIFLLTSRAWRKPVQDQSECWVNKHLQAADKGNEKILFECSSQSTTVEVDFTPVLNVISFDRVSLECRWSVANCSTKPTQPYYFKAAVAIPLYFPVLCWS